MIDFHLKECPYCCGNDLDCEWCGGLGRLIQNPETIMYNIQVELAKLDWFKKNPQEHFDTHISWFNDYDSNGEVTLEANFRMQHEILDDIADSYKTIDRLTKTHKNLDNQYIHKLNDKGYKFELSAFNLCKVCTQEHCATCNNKPENVFVEDCYLNFMPITEEIKKWYYNKGYKLETY